MKTDVLLLFSIIIPLTASYPRKTVDSTALRPFPSSANSSGINRGSSGPLSHDIGTQDTKTLLNAEILSIQIVKRPLDWLPFAIGPLFHSGVVVRTAKPIDGTSEFLIHKVYIVHFHSIWAEIIVKLEIFREQALESIKVATLLSQKQSTCQPGGNILEDE